jgi:hypothetical protein
MLRQLVRRLRSKIGQARGRPGDGDDPDAPEPVRIETIPGLGYGLVVEAT